MSLIKKIKDYYRKGHDKKNVLFTTPSHNQGQFIPVQGKKLLGENFYRCDFSETDGFDNIRAPQDTLKCVLDKFTHIYNSKRTFLLTNGSTSGNISLMLTVLNDGDKVLLARNCHISVYNGLVLTGAVPVWLLPDYDNEWGIYKGVDAKIVDTYLQKNKDIKAVIITSPTYEGVFSDVTEISAVCKKHKVLLIVDEAHGALLNFGNFRVKPAIQCGADASVQSLHKTAGAPNPCALLHVAKNSPISVEKVQQSLNLINTTSPSYPLMLASEITVDFLNSYKGRNTVKKLLEDIESFKLSLPDNVKAFDEFNDPTKILLKLDGIGGFIASDILNNEYNIEEEFSNEQSMLFLCGVGTTKKKLNKLLSSIKKITITESADIKTNCSLYEIPQYSCSPREAYQKKSVEIDVLDSIGAVSAEVVTEYPPGIPVLLPGEIISEKILPFLKNKKIKICI